MSYLPLVEIESEPVNFPPAVVSHLVQEEVKEANCAGKLSKSGNIAVIAKVCHFLASRLLNNKDIFRGLI